MNNEENGSTPTINNAFRIRVYKILDDGLLHLKTKRNTGAMCVGRVDTRDIGARSVHVKFVTTQTI